MLWAALVLAVLAGLLFLLSRRTRRSSGLPAGRVVYTDTRPLGAPQKPLYDRDLGLVGKPDYLVEQEGVVVPVEVKSGWAPDQPREGHVLQLLAYCRLVEASTGVRPPLGLLRYRNRTFAIDYTPEAEAELLAVMEEMRADERRRTAELHRSHEQPVRCAHCGYRQLCPERLDQAG